MAIAIGLTLVMAFSALLWITPRRISLHITIAMFVIPAAYIFGHFYGLSAGLLIANGIIAAMGLRYVVAKL